MSKQVNENDIRFYMDSIKEPGFEAKNDAEKKIIEDYNAVLCEFCGRAFVKHITKILSMDAIFTLPEDKAKM